MATIQQEHLWQAFSTLSDAQMLMDMGDNDSANDMVNHAKRHMLILIDDWTQEDLGDAMISKCKLPTQATA